MLEGDSVEDFVMGEDEAEGVCSVVVGDDLAVDETKVLGVGGEFDNWGTGRLGGRGQLD